MPGKQTSRQLRTQLIANAVLLAGFGALPLIIVGKNSVERIDAAAAAREKAQTSAAVVRRQRELPIEQRSSTVWDQAVLKVEEGDAIWMEGNLGVWMQDYFGHDLNFVLDPALHPKYAAVGGETKDPAVFDDVAALVLPLAQAVRSMVLAGELEAEDIFMTANMALKGGPALVSVIPIIPDTDRLELEPQDTHYHVAVDYLDAAYLATVTHGLALSDPAIVGPEEGGSWPNSVAIKDNEGAVVARLVWTPSTPARNLVAALSPALILWLFGGGILVFSLTRRLIRTTEDLQQSEAHARYLAFHDPLTRLPNRALFEDRLSQALSMIERGGPAVTLLMLDLDRFKNVNDTLGHPAGDELIRQVGERIRGRLRRSDTVARLGGDEFAVILVGEMVAAEFDSFCEELIGEISRPCNLFGREAQVSASIGGCRAGGGEMDAAELVRRADIALYHSKRAGRGRHCLYSADMDAGIAL